MAFRMIRIGTARFADEAACGQAMRHTPGGGSEYSCLQEGLDQFVAGRSRPRSRHLTPEDTRITSYRDRGTLTAMRLRTAGLPSLVKARAEVAALNSIQA